MKGAGPLPNPAVVLDSSECAALPLSEIISGDRRLDAETYLSDGFMIRSKIRRSLLRRFPLGELAKIWRPIPSRMKATQVDREHGVPFVTATQVYDVWPTPRKWIAPSKTPNLSGRYVYPGWILITCSGSVGNVIMAYSAHANLVVSDDLLRVDIYESEMRGYVYIFLRTEFGRAMMRSGQYGSVIKHLDINHLAQVPVPVIDHLVKPMGVAVDEVFTMRNEAYKLDMVAQSIFGDSLPERPKNPSMDSGFQVSASHLFSGRRRLEGYAYSPASRFVTQVYNQNAEDVISLGEIAQVRLPNRFKRIFGQGGTPYLDSEPIFKINPNITKFLTPATKIDFDTYVVRRGWLLMARSGQIYGLNGQAMLANERHESKVITEHIVRIIPNSEEIRSGYLQTVLQHPTLGRPLVVSRAYGTSVPELAPEDIRRLPLPRLKSGIEDKIADAAEQANELRRRADEKEDKAVSDFESELNGELDHNGMNSFRDMQGPVPQWA